MTAPHWLALMAALSFFPLGGTAFAEAVENEAGETGEDESGETANREDESDETSGTETEADDQDQEAENQESEHGEASREVTPGEGEGRRRVTFEWLPGGCCQIPRGLSASRDTAGFTIMLTPYSVISAGGDLALFAIDFKRAASLRLALFGMIELESSKKFDASEDGFVGLFPVADVGLWRGLNGASLALSFDGFARLFLPEGSAFELILSFRHESEHFTGPGEAQDEWVGVPHIGDFLMPELAIHLPVGVVDLQARTQLKFFLPSGGVRRYTYGPGLDAMVRWRLVRWLHPFFSFFYEHLLGGEDSSGEEIPNNFLVRLLLGVVFPGRIADFQLFGSMAYGHGKGLLAFQQELLWGGGFRIIVPAVNLGRDRVQFTRRRLRDEANP